MAHHRCSRCKQEALIRHKRHGYLPCERCLGFSTRPRRFRDLFSGFWARLARFVDTALGRTPEQLKVQRKQEATRQYVMRKEMRNAALNVPMNPGAVVPQKR